MTVRDVIVQKIKEEYRVLDPITEKTNVYSDLGLDSLSFVLLLTELEDLYEISFDIGEMENFLEIGNLVTAIEDRIKESKVDND